MLNRKIVASAAAVALATGLVACSNDEQAAVVSETATATNTNTATETVAAETETASSTATETVTSSAKESGAAAAGADATQELTLADGKTALVPQGVLDTMDEYAEPTWGEPTAVEEIDGGWIVTYDNEHYITWKESTGGSPIWGAIADSWLNDVRGARTVGFPLMPETPNTDGSGWNQEFENGTIDWSRDGSADAPFKATVNTK
ncbi:hypothetical protein M5J20_06045 [Corynebacterium sp. TA-R-1]|uniref:LGFP repeat-containing protein n=1 Tax=Corynebacterium stercoris TaxID=2943490 RepID=A0ABT1G185_9CORY|nr:hypothetical protein [Corynebacterium stercoris]MCP1387750.1 hypothetical protein [Corynebacterium stercoris]